MYVADIDSIPELLELRAMVQSDYASSNRTRQATEQFVWDAEDIETRILELKAEQR